MGDDTCPRARTADNMGSTNESAGSTADPDPTSKYISTESALGEAVVRMHGSPDQASTIAIEKKRIELAMRA